MPHDQQSPNGGRASESAQGDGDGRHMKDAPTDTQKALDAGSGEPRDLPADGHGGSANPDPDRDRPS